MPETLVSLSMQGKLHSLRCGRMSGGKIQRRVPNVKNIKTMEEKQRTHVAIETTVGIELVNFLGFVSKGQMAQGPLDECYIHSETRAKKLLADATQRLRPVTGDQ